MGTDVNHRSFISTLVISLVSNGVGGLIWIGRPLSGILLLGLLVSAATAILTGVVSIPSTFMASPNLHYYGAMLLVSLVPVLLRKYASPLGWSSKWYWSLIIPAVLAGFSAILIRSLLVQPFSIPAGSMIPTLVPGDLIAVNKRVYGYSRFSFPYNLVNVDGRTVGGLPRRGDVVVIQSNGVNFVKRVIGLPEEIFQMVGGVPYVNGIPFNQTEQGEYVLDAEGIQATSVLETTPEGIKYTVLNLQHETLGDNTPEFKIPIGHYFLLGDHRDNSSDSKFTLGFVSIESFAGRVDRILANEIGHPFKERAALNQ